MVVFSWGFGIPLNPNICVDPLAPRKWGLSDFGDISHQRYNIVIDGEVKRNTSVKLVETTIIEADALQWSTMLRHGEIDGNPVMRRMRKRLNTRTHV